MMLKKHVPEKMFGIVREEVLGKYCIHAGLGCAAKGDRPDNAQQTWTLQFGMGGHLCLDRKGKGVQVAARTLSRPDTFALPLWRGDK